jgi:FkbM family methyltransferase
MTRRWGDLGQRAYTYFLVRLEHPRELPHVAWSALGKRIYPGGLVSLILHRDWLPACGINTVIDVRNHRSEFAFVARAVLPQNRIFCFEPLLECVEHLRRIARQDSAVRVFGEALRNRSGELLHFPRTAGCTALAVRMPCLNEYQNEMDLTPRVLLRIDTQGYEYEVLPGLKRGSRG